MSLVFVFAASKQEAQPVGRIARIETSSEKTANRESVRIGPNEVVLITGGMGPKGAREKAKEVFGVGQQSASPNPPFKRKPDAALTIGLCGGLVESLPETTIVAYTECLSTEPGKAPRLCCPTLTNRLVELLKSQSIGCESLPAITSPVIAVTRDDKLALAKRGASVVDMESYEIISVAAKAGIPVAALRVVSDSLDRKMPDFNRALDEHGALDGRKALRVALGSPLQTLRLLRANKLAMRYLATALAIVLTSDSFSETKYN